MESQACQNAGAATRCTQTAPTWTSHTSHSFQHPFFRAQIFRMRRTSGSGLYSTEVTASLSCITRASTSAAAAYSTDLQARSAHSSSGVASFISSDETFSSMSSSRSQEPART
jgi:hypothetical protein